VPSLAEVGGPAAALAALDELDLDLDSYHLFNTTRAELLARLGRDNEARAAYDRALARTKNAAERAHLEHRRAALG
jgi:predicted RNA polymerase sigma factor